MSAAWSIAKIAFTTSPLGLLIVQGAETAMKAISSASDQGVEKLQDEVTKQNLQMQFMQVQAKVSQELAIAARIETAEQVEIEEYYDASGKGNIGLNVDVKAEAGALGLGGEGRRVTKRIYRFTGWRAGAEGSVTDAEVVEVTR